MYECIEKLLKNYEVNLKVIHLILSSTCLALMIHYETYELPRWLWIIYSIDSLTYLFIALLMLMSYILKSNCRSYDFYFMVLGIPTNITAAIGGLIQEVFIDPHDAQNGPNQLYLSSLLGFISILMILQVIVTIYTAREKYGEHTENTSGTHESTS